MSFRAGCERDENRELGDLFPRAGIFLQSETAPAPGACFGSLRIKVSRLWRTMGLGLAASFGRLLNRNSGTCPKTARSQKDRARPAPRFRA
jgi:hypothetical protein